MPYGKGSLYKRDSLCYAYPLAYSKWVARKTDKFVQQHDVTAVLFYCAHPMRSVGSFSMIGNSSLATFSAGHNIGKHVSCAAKQPMLLAAVL
jgi:hypothetical protein